MWIQLLLIIPLTLIAAMTVVFWLLEYFERKEQQQKHAHTLIMKITELTSALNAVASQLKDVATAITNKPPVPPVVSDEVPAETVTAFNDVRDAAQKVADLVTPPAATSTSNAS